MKTTEQHIRKYDLDWIKILVMFVVFLYHCSMFFNSFDWHVKNNVTNKTYIEVFSLLVGNWMMPIFFVISGIGTFYALQKRNSKGFLKERFFRLGFPLLLGVFILSPPQVFIERISNKQFEGSFFAFFPSYFDGLYLEIGGTGNFAFFGHHLWYLLMLLLFSYLTLPFFLKLRSMSNSSFTMFHYVLLPLPLLLVAVLGNHILNLASWGLLFYLILYIYGFYFFSRQGLRVFIYDTGVVTGIVSVTSTIAYVVWIFTIGFPVAGTIESIFFMILRVILVWNTLFFILYLAGKYLNFSNELLKYSNEASMPFYVLHQPIIILLGFFISGLAWPVSLKLFILISVSFIMIMVVYHTIIRRVNFIRTIFGMSKQNKLKTIKKDKVENVI